MGPDPHSCWFLLLSVKWYDNDDVKGVNFLQGKFHSFHLVATIVNYLTKAPLVHTAVKGLFWFSCLFF